MSDRVRAVLITPDDKMLTIGRIRPGRAFYSVLPGGGVEDRDRSLEAALLREIDEELGGQAVIHSLIHIDDSVPGQRQYIFLARIDAWDIRARSGPEFNDPARGQYLLQTTPLTRDAVAGLNLLPDAVAVLLADHVRVLFAMVDLREMCQRTGRPGSVWGHRDVSP
ncbi:NUDIX hydrolase [Nonomuraea turcica]|uniref:NUDIX hydrolase n=1 Tax=Nonomuraea sp. G32 TaxID=3067274 RepID=UPI00273AFE3B|nr:NUDIX domain-containing protein [Nonomuraea sp. G32]MDP4505842.1 NUDIX domain-containing protein [Nonomuraea sp. G32]